MFYEKRVALANMRIQPLHAGHTGNLKIMAETCETCILGIGSTNVFDRWNPFSFEVRKKMIQNVYGDRFRIIPLADIGTQDGTTEWVDYVLEKIEKIGLPEPTDYFTGSRADGRWYAERFYNEVFDFPSGQIRTPNGQYKILHILDRDQNPVPPATDLRTFLELGCNDWKEWVPRVNWQLVEDNFPDEFKIGKGK